MVAIVPETARYARTMKEESTVRFPILLDIDNGYAMSLNLAVWIDDEMKDMMTALGRALPDYQGNDTWMLPIPATFVVGRDGRIMARFVDPDYRKRMAVDGLLQALKS
jgi:peroxiredoxin